MPFLDINKFGRNYNACLQILQARFQSGSIPFFLRFFFVYLLQAQEKMDFMFFIKMPDKILQKYLSVKSALFTYLYVFFKIIFLTENKLNLIKRLKFGRFSFFGLAFFVACRQSVFHCLQKVCFLLHEVLKHRQIPDWNLGCKFCRHALQALRTNFCHKSQPNLSYLVVSMDTISGYDPIVS